MGLRKIGVSRCCLRILIESFLYGLIPAFKSVGPCIQIQPVGLSVLGRLFLQLLRLVAGQTQAELVGDLFRDLRLQRL